MKKQVIIDTDGNIDSSNLDDLEIHLISKIADGVKGVTFLKTVVNAIGDVLGFELVDGEVEKSVQCADKPFRWLDLRFGSGRYNKSADPEGYMAIRFARKEGELDKTDRDRREKANQLAASGTTHHYGPMADYYTIPDGGWPEPYYFEIAPEINIPEIHRDLLQVFLPEKYRSGGARFDRYFQMHINACAELARRLGYRPVFDDYIS